MRHLLVPLALLAICIALAHAKPFSAYDASYRVRVPTGNNVTLDVGINGNGSSVIVLLHGFPEASGIWAPVIDLLNSQGRHKIIFPDLRGYNRSSQPKPIDSYNIKLLVNDVDVLINTFSQGKPVTLVGHDWGGIIAWVYAYTYPQKLSGLMILNAPHPSVFENLIKTSKEQRKAVPYMLPFIHHPDITAYGLRLLNYQALRSQLPDSVDQNMVNALTDAWSHGSVNSMLYYYSANFDTENVFHWAGFNSTIPNPLPISVPTTVGWGMDDKIFLADLNLPAMSQYVSQLSISKYPTAGHFPITDVPAAITADIRKLIKE